MKTEEDMHDFGLVHVGLYMNILQNDLGTDTVGHSFAPRGAVV